MNTLRHLLVRIQLEREEGQTMAEYGILIAVIALIAITGATFFGNGLSTFFSDLAGNCVVKHVPNARNHPQVTVRNLHVKPSRLLSIDDTILGARHDNNRHRQFLIAVPHRDGTWDHCNAVLTLRADLPGP